MKLKIRLLNMAVPPTTEVSGLPRHQDREHIVKLDELSINWPIEQLIMSRDFDSVTQYVYWLIFRETCYDYSSVMNVKIIPKVGSNKPETFWRLLMGQKCVMDDMTFSLFGEEMPFCNNISRTIGELRDENIINVMKTDRLKLKNDDFFRLYKPIRLPIIGTVFVNYDNKVFYQMSMQPDEDRIYAIGFYYGFDSDLSKEITFIDKWFEPVHTEETREENVFQYLYASCDGLRTTVMNMDYYDTSIEFVRRNYNDDIPYRQIEDFITGETPGICLFHGEPGGGKTTYIKYLMAKHTNMNFIYCPSSIFEQCTESEIAGFMMRQGRDTVYLIEDCESLISDRNRGHNHILPTILNFSDGIVGSALRPKFIMTFNCPESQVDKAVLRKGRLKIKYNFQKLSLEKTRAIKPDATEPMTLADIYNNEPNGQAQSKAIGFQS